MVRKKKNLEQTGVLAQGKARHMGESTHHSRGCRDSHVLRRRGQVLPKKVEGTDCSERV